MRKWFLAISLFGLISSSFGIDYNGRISVYDDRISKYDINNTYFNFKIENRNGYYNCIGVSKIEKDSIISDLKSERLKAKKDPNIKEVIYLSNNFNKKEVYIYFKTKFNCLVYLDVMEFNSYE